MTEHIESGWADRVEAIEAGYEFMLAYAAQGRENDDPTSQIRQFLEGMYTALDGLAEVGKQAATHKNVLGSEAFLELIASDGKKTRAALALVIAQDNVSSQLIDNLNASIHVRALLTDLFLIDEILKQSP
ncbi:MAG: hypothetical protein HOH43_15155 [Candidatus Latescibacteria bacterium]|jgi:hypothetical protein|nr:hypothetical protein [Candidatus Latescibacterota bacterium]